jgi:hypothetical protein
MAGMIVCGCWQVAVMVRQGLLTGPVDKEGEGGRSPKTRVPATPRSSWILENSSDRIAAQSGPEAIAEY